MNEATSPQSGFFNSEAELNEVTPFCPNSSRLELLVPRVHCSETSKASFALLLNSYASSHAFWQIAALSLEPTNSGVGKILRRNGFIGALQRTRTDDSYWPRKTARPTFVPTQMSMMPSAFTWPTASWRPTPMPASGEPSGAAAV